jgi:WD40 repeat protein
MDSEELPEPMDFLTKRPKIKEAKSYKTKVKRHREAVIQLYSVNGDKSELMLSGSADNTARGKYILLIVAVWNLKD